MWFHGVVGSTPRRLGEKMDFSPPKPNLANIRGGRAAHLPSQDSCSALAHLRKLNEIRTLVLQALEHVDKNYSGPFLLPRITFEAGAQITGELLDFSETVLLLKNPDDCSTQFLDPAPEREPAIEDADNISDIYTQLQCS
ncbi:hypothetical protein L873DRAFT_307610 [Choiromyces venosus 120613-1]|uniref:Uncharacterized protein n=1 Tax=Choiromyces venosus 120613-1 TaxID=1336337 RepID=A0A3N4JC87_9PEZI|nr:hypothetical protein L873DRAFT_307610 [Choiromyces venosus 120613-1]